MKKIFVLFMSFLTLFLLVGCDKKETKKVPSEVASIKKKYSNIKKDNLKWDYNKSTKTIIISGKGKMKSYFEEEPEWINLSNEALKIVIGDEVTSISDGAFWYFENINEVKLGNSVQYIGQNAFDNCINLRTINFPDSLKYIGDYAFNNNILHSSNSFILPEGLIFVGDSAFYSAFKESYVSIPKSLITISDNAFANCFVEKFKVDENNKNYKSVDGILYDKKITTLINYPALKTTKTYKIPKTVKVIKENAIEVTSDLEKIIVPKNTKEIEGGSIFWNYGLKYIEVDKDNPKYESVDNVLYSKDKKRLLSYPIASENSEYTVNEKTEVIDKYAISNAKNLKKLTIKEGVKTLNTGAIYYCENLEELSLPKTLTKIYEYGIENNNKLKVIKYNSNKDDFNKIKIKKNNNILKSSNIKVEYIKKK